MSLQLYHVFLATFGRDENIEAPGINPIRVLEPVILPKYILVVVKHNWITFSARQMSYASGTLEPVPLQFATAMRRH